MPALIVMPADAPAIKVAATRSHGAEIVFYDRYTEDREALGSRLAAKRQMTLIPPYDHADVMAGQGTAALELIEDVGPLDALFVCVGGGGLISGCAVAAAARSPGCRVIGVEPQAGDDVRQSLTRGERVRIAVPQTLADGAQTQSPGELTFAVMRALVAEVATVDDAALVSTMRWMAEQLKLVVEPTGCLAAAAALTPRPELAGRRIGVVLSGGNVDLARFAALVGTQSRTGEPRSGSHAGERRTLHKAPSRSRSPQDRPAETGLPPPAHAPGLRTRYGGSARVHVRLGAARLGKTAPPTPAGCQTERDQRACDWRSGAPRPRS
jgi:threonine dehydratase